jgi:hypothetical protein
MIVEHLKDKPYDYTESIQGEIVVTEYEVYDWDGDGCALILCNGEVLYYNLGHCSCYGPFEGGPSQRYSIEEYRSLKDSVQMSWSDTLDLAFRRHLDD